MLSDLATISHEAKRRILTTLLTARSGHLGGSLSSIELMVSLYFGNILRYDPAQPDHPLRDRVLVRGHLGPLRYSLFSMLGWIKEEELLTYRRLHSRLQGHEMMKLIPGVDITPSGSLGMLLSYGTGAAYAFRVHGLQPITYVFLGDGEEQEGNVSEAARHASSLGLDNLVCIIDRNQKQLSRPTCEVDGMSDLAKIWDGYGWSVRKIEDGHSFPQILEALNFPRAIEQPTLIIANTVKGRGIDGAEDHTSGYHTIGSCPRDKALESLRFDNETATPESELHSAVQRRVRTIAPLPGSEEFQSVSTRLKLEPIKTSDYDEALMGYLQQLSSAVRESPSSTLYSLTADWTAKNLAQGCGFLEKGVHYLDVGIREQHMLAMSHGIAVSDREAVIIVTDGDFLALRAADQLQAIAQAGSRVIVLGTDSGICEPFNGATHQSSGQPGALVSMPGLVFLEPADSIDLKNCLEQAVEHRGGPVYVRLHSGSVDPLPLDDLERNTLAYIAYQPVSDVELIIVTSGLTLDGSIKFARGWDHQGKGVRVVNVVNPQELGSSFAEIVEDKPVLTVYNGNPYILQSAVARAIMESPTSKRPPVILGHGFLVGTSGRLEELLSHFGFDESGIESVVRSLFPELS